MAEYNPIKKLNKTKNHSLRAHINAMCAHCMGCTMDHMEPGFSQEIRNCTAPNCPLYAVRPYQEKRA